MNEPTNGELLWRVLLSIGGTVAVVGLLLVILEGISFPAEVAEIDFVRQQVESGSYTNADYDALLVRVVKLNERISNYRNSWLRSPGWQYIKTIPVPQRKADKALPSAQEGGKS